MKTIFTLAIAILSLSSTMANSFNTTNVHERTIRFYSAEDSIIFDPSNIFVASSVSVEYMISENNKIIGTSDELTAAVKTMEEIASDDRKITDAKLPELMPLDFKKINCRPTVTVRKNNAIVSGN